MTTLITIPKTAPDFGRVRQAIAHRYQKPKTKGDPYHEKFRPVLLADHDGERVLVALDGRRAARALVESPALLEAAPGLYDVKSDKAAAVELVPSGEDAKAWPHWEQLFPNWFAGVPCVPVENKAQLLYAVAAFGILVDPEIPIICEGVLFIQGRSMSLVIQGEGISAVYMPWNVSAWQTDVDAQAREYFDEIKKQEQQKQEWIAGK